MAQDMPCGMYIRRRGENLFVKEYPTPVSCSSTDWLAYVEQRDNVAIQHSRNNKEYRVGNKNIAVDGFNRLGYNAAH